MKLKNKLYKTSRKLNKAAGVLGDIEAIVSMSPKKIFNRFTNKAKNKVIYKTANKISKKTNKRT